MKVVIDISPLQSTHKTRGIGIYTHQLVKALKAVDQANDFILTSRPHELQADLIHYPYFDFFFNTLPLHQPCPAVVTIHDTIPLVFPNHYPPGIKGKLRFIRQKLALKSISAIITDSHNSKKDIVHYLYQDVHKVHVVHLAASQSFKKTSPIQQKKILAKYHLPPKYLLYVGDINYNKNLPYLIKAFASINKPIHLVLVARALKHKHIPESQIIYQTIDQLQLKNRIHILTQVPLDPSSDLAAIYSAATAYIHPSLYEGFGLPVLEAMQCQTPVVCSNTSSLPEVGGEAAIYINPNQINDITKGINKILNLSPTQRRALIKTGLIQSSQFSWEKTALETIKVYQQLIKQ